MKRIIIGLALAVLAGVAITQAPIWDKPTWWVDSLSWQEYKDHTFGHPSWSDTAHELPTVCPSGHGAETIVADMPYESYGFMALGNSIEIIKRYNHVWATITNRPGHEYVDEQHGNADFRPNEGARRVCLITGIDLHHITAAFGDGHSDGGHDDPPPDDDDPMHCPTAHNSRVTVATEST